MKSVMMNASQKIERKKKSDKKKLTSLALLPIVVYYYCQTKCFDRSKAKTITTICVKMDFGNLAKFQTKGYYHSMKAHVLMKKNRLHYLGGHSITTYVIVLVTQLNRNSKPFSIQIELLRRWNNSIFDS